MKKHIKLIAAVLTAMIVLALAACLMAACNNTPAEEGELSVEFDLNYAGAGKPELKTFKRSEFSSLAKPQREGYDFAGWTNDPEGREKVSERTVKDGSTLYAQWERKKYNVKFLVDGHEIGEAQKVLHGDTAIPPEITEFWQYVPKDKAFEGWDKQLNNVTSDLSVNATFVAREFTAQFKDGDVVVAEYGGRTGGNIPAPPTVKKDGFEFAGWLTADGDEYASGTSKFASDVIYLAKWTMTAPTQWGKYRSAERDI